MPRQHLGLGYSSKQQARPVRQVGLLADLPRMASRHIASSKGCQHPMPTKNEVSKVNCPLLSVLLSTGSKATAPVALHLFTNRQTSPRPSIYACGLRTKLLAPLAKNRPLKECNGLITHVRAFTEPKEPYRRQRQQAKKRFGEPIISASKRHDQDHILTALNAITKCDGISLCTIKWPTFFCPSALPPPAPRPTAGRPRVK